MHMSFCNILALQSANTCKWSYSCIWEQAWLMSSRRFLKCWMVVSCHKEAREDYYSHVLAVFSWLIWLALLIRVNTPLELACYLTQTSDDNKRSVSKQSLLSFSRGLLNENAKVCLKCKKLLISTHCYLKMPHCCSSFCSYSCKILLIHKPKNTTVSIL